MTYWGGGEGGDITKMESPRGQHYPRDLVDFSDQAVRGCVTASRIG
jgi:hypothetical protein